MKRFLFVVVCLLLFIGVVDGVLAVLANLSRPPSSILTSTECAPPCWHGIRPGETSSWRMLDFLLGQDWVIGGSIRERTKGNETTQIAWMFQRPAGDTAGYAYFQDDRVTAISIRTIGSLNVNELFDVLGEPKTMVALSRNADTRHWVELNLIYPDEGFLVEVDIDRQAHVQQNQVEIAEETPVYRVVFFEPSRYADLLGERVLIDRPIDTITSNIQPWSGFGLINYEN